MQQGAKKQHPSRRTDLKAANSAAGNVARLSQPSRRVDSMGRVGQTLLAIKRISKINK